jgi:hypothetical protein
MPWGCGFPALFPNKKHRGTSAASTEKLRLKGSSAGQEVKDENDDGENQKDMNPAAEGIAADQTYDPKDEEDNGDSPKHLSFS